MGYDRNSKQTYAEWKSEMIEARKQEMTFLMPNLFTFCEGTRVDGKSALFSHHERG